MGSSLSCFKKPREGAVRAVPERRPVSASELQRPASSFTASTSLTLEPKERQSMEVERVSEIEKPVPEVEFERAEKLVSEKEDISDVGIVKIDVIETPREVGDNGESDTILEVDTPIAGSTLDDIGATDGANELVDMQVRAERKLSAINESQGYSVETRSRESSVEAEGPSKLSLPPKAPSLESMPASLKGVLEEPVGERVREDKERLADVVRPGAMKGRNKQKKLEFKRSDTLLNVRSSLSVRTHVTNYEKIEAAARVDPEEMVKSGKAKFVVASA